MPANHWNVGSPGFI